MSDSCLTRRELDDLLWVEPGDPRLHHVNRCPRCRSELVLRRSFLAGDPDLADPVREKLLSERVHQVIFGGNPVSGNGGSGWSRLISPLGGGLLALAAVLVVFLAFNRFQVPTGDSGLHLRGSQSVAIDPLAPTVASDGDSGDLFLSWTTLPGAREYRVEILGGDLGVLEKGITTDSSPVRLDAEYLAQWRAGSPLLLWRVTAVGDEGVLARSAPVPLTAP